MDDKLKIHLQIDRIRYPLSIKREEEIFYRDAAKMIDNKLNRYRSLYPDKGDVSHLTMVALDLALDNVRMKDIKDDSHYVEKLTILEKVLDEYIEKYKLNGNWESK